MPKKTTTAQKATPKTPPKSPPAPKKSSFQVEAENKKKMKNQAAKQPEEKTLPKVKEAAADFSVSIINPEISRRGALEKVCDVVREDGGEMLYSELIAQLVKSKLPNHVRAVGKCFRRGYLKKNPL